MMDKEHQDLLIERLDDIMAEISEIRKLLIECSIRDTEEREVEQKEETRAETEPGSSFMDLGASSTLVFDSSVDDDIDDFIEKLQEEEEYVPTPSEEPEPPFPQEEETSEALLDSFIPAGSIADMEQTFEAKVHFFLLDRISLADNYLFANELFQGNQAELKNVLNELEQMSSMGQAEDYLYHSIGLEPNRSEVKRFVAFIRQNAETI